MTWSWPSLHAKRDKGLTPEAEEENKTLPLISDTYTALLQYNPYTIHVTHLKYGNSVVFSVAANYTVITTVHFRTFSSPQKETSPFAVTPPLLGPCQPTTHPFFSLQRICLLWLFQINGIIQYVTPGMMIPGFLRVVACVGLHSFSG